mmetsp:Transcript_98175/g.278203  ORF Transcript_98175/g.278203 Transcript_98175/m.278203 type:complete len:234 (-) Transcript_98175:180-881(-)
MAGAVQVESVKAAVAKHDHFNIVAISLLVSVTLITMSLPTPWTDGSLTYLTFAYVITDTVYLLWVPHVLPNMSRRITLAVHHLLTMWLLLHPMLHWEHMYMTKSCTIVEINTLLHTANRLRKSRWLEAGFFATWIGMRLCWYPYLIHEFSKTMVAWGAVPAITDYAYCQVVGCIAGLNALNFFWTAELLVNMLCNRWRHDEHKSPSRSTRNIEVLRPNLDVSQELMRVQRESG